MTKFIMQFLRDRNEPVPPEDLVQVAKKIKEKYSYVCKGDLVKEFESYDVREEGDELSSKFKTYKGVNSVNGQVLHEIFFVVRVINYFIFFILMIFNFQQFKNLLTYLFRFF